MPFHIAFSYAGLNYTAPAVQGTAGQVLALKAGLEDTEWIAAGGGGGSPGGADTHIQINDAGVFFGEAAFAYNKTTNVVTVIGGAVVGNAVYNAAVKLNLTQPEDGFALIMGADASADSRTNATRKFLRVGLPHYLNAEEPVALLSGDSDGTDNIVSIGGGFGAGNAATAIRFLTGANNVTIVGTSRMIIWPNGDIGVGLITPPEAKFDVSGTLRIRGAATFDASIVANTVVATSFNGVALTTAGSATDFLNAQGNYVAAGGGGGTPGGADTNVQINDGGVFFGEAAFSYNKTTNVLTVSGGFVGNLTGDVAGTASNALALGGVTPSGFFLTLVDDASAGAFRGNIGLGAIDAVSFGSVAAGSMSVIGDIAAASFNNVSITTAGVGGLYLDDTGNYVAVAYGSLTGTPATFAPSAHAASHQAGGGDAIKLDNLAVPDDNTDLDVSITAHGLAPKLPNDAAKFLNGVGGYTVPAAVSAIVGVVFKIGNGVDVITTGTKVTADFEIPFAMTITGWRLIADVSGSIVLDVWKKTTQPPAVGDTITASAKPTLSAAAEANSTILTGWTTAVAAFDKFRISVDSVATVKAITLVLYGPKT